MNIVAIGEIDPNCTRITRGCETAGGLRRNWRLPQREAGAAASDRREHRSVLCATSGRIKWRVSGSGRLRFGDGGAAVLRKRGACVLEP